MHVICIISFYHILNVTRIEILVLLIIHKLKLQLFRKDLNDIQEEELKDTITDTELDNEPSDKENKKPNPQGDSNSINDGQFEGDGVYAWKY